MKKVMIHPGNGDSYEMVNKTCLVDHEDAKEAVAEVLKEVHDSLSGVIHIWVYDEFDHKRIGLVMTHKKFLNCSFTIEDKEDDAE